MTANLFEYHTRRARQHQLFALSAANCQLRHSHKQLAVAYGAVAHFMHGRNGLRQLA
jgi:hypothetical protein